MPDLPAMARADGVEFILALFVDLVVYKGTGTRAPSLPPMGSRTHTARLDPVEGGRRVANYLRVLTMEAQAIARACGKAHLLHLEPEDLVAVTIEAAAMARVPLAGTNWVPGR